MRNFIARKSLYIVTTCTGIVILGLLMNSTPLMLAGVTVSAATVLTNHFTKA